jgi:hypothetical protein
MVQRPVDRHADPELDLFSGLKDDVGSQEIQSSELIAATCGIPEAPGAAVGHVRD